MLWTQTCVDQIKTVCIWQDTRRSFCTFCIRQGIHSHYVFFAIIDFRLSFIIKFITNLNSIFGGNTTSKIVGAFFRFSFFKTFFFEFSTFRLKFVIFSMACMIFCTEFITASTFFYKIPIFLMCFLNSTIISY
uniref:Uncharacterized protein n=1 Tax=Cacopsylla melanoneura TaxID=428564 RepID=A0A8D9BS68_9HEMI